MIPPSRTRTAEGYEYRLAVGTFVHKAGSGHGAPFHHGAGGVRFFGIGLPNPPRGLSPLSSACLYLRTQSSTPWAKLANSLDSTFFSKYSIISGGRVTLRDCFFRAMHAKCVQITINISNQHWPIALILVQEDQNMPKTPQSAEAMEKPLIAKSLFIQGEDGNGCQVAYMELYAPILSEDAQRRANTEASEFMRHLTDIIADSILGGRS